MALGRYKASELRGRHIYQIKNRTIYSDFFMKDYGYLITNYDADKYYSYSLRGFESVFGLVLLLLISKSNYLVSFTAAILAYVVLTFLFYFKFLKSLQKVDNFIKPKRDNFFVETAKEMSSKRIIALAIATALFGLICIYYPISNNYEGLFRQLLMALGSIAIIFSIMNIISLIYKIIKKV